MAELIRWSRALSGAVVACAVLAGAVGLSPVARAADETSAPMPTPVIAIVDYEMIMQESAAARSVRTAIEKYQQSMQDEVSKEEAALRTRQQDLDAQRKTLSQEAFAEKARAFDGSVAEFQRKLLMRRRALDRASGAGMAKVQQVMFETAGRVAAARTANIVLPKSVVFLFDEKFNISAEVLDKLNKELAHVDVPAPKLEEEGGIPLPAGGGDGKSADSKKKAK